MKRMLLVLLVLVLGACGPSMTTAKQACVVAMQGAKTGSDSVIVGDLRSFGFGQVSCRSFLREPTK